MLLQCSVGHDNSQLAVAPVKIPLRFANDLSFSFRWFFSFFLRRKLWPLSTCFNAAILPVTCHPYVNCPFCCTESSFSSFLLFPFIEGSRQSMWFLIRSSTHPRPLLPSLLTDHGIGLQRCHILMSSLLHSKHVPKSLSGLIWILRSFYPPDFMEGSIEGGSEKLTQLSSHAGVLLGDAQDVVISSSS